ncbi:MAG: DUF4860 domain-containing protein [Clostridia bacterium]|nr:DUF4860 domain-containing protein [Clostridia bacterium]
MSGKTGTNHSIAGVFVFLLLGIFAVFSTVMVLLGAKAYKATSERTTNHNDTRIASAYLRSMVRSGDEADSVLIEDIDGIRAVTLVNVYDDTVYYTRLYTYDGMLRELFTEADLEFEPENGEAVCVAESMTAEFRGNILNMRIQNGDDWTDADIALRSAAH